MEDPIQSPQQSPRQSTTTAPPPDISQSPLFTTHQNLLAISNHSESNYYSQNTPNSELPRSVADKLRYNETKARTVGYMVQGMSAIAYQMFTACVDVKSAVAGVEEGVASVGNEVGGLLEVSIDVLQKKGGCGFYDRSTPIMKLILIYLATPTSCRPNSPTISWPSSVPKTNWPTAT